VGNGLYKIYNERPMEESKLNILAPDEKERRKNGKTLAKNEASEKCWQVQTAIESQTQKKMQENGPGTGVGPYATERTSKRELDVPLEGLATTLRRPDPWGFPKNENVGKCDN